MRVFECHQYSPEWWAIRRGVPTASAFDNIITPTGKPSASMRKYACQLIAEKFDAYYGQEEQYQSAAMESGSLLEPQAKSFYEYTRDVEVREVGFCFVDGDRYGCSPDALIGEAGVLESKSPLPKTHIEYLIGDDVPDKYRPQCHGHLIVTGREWCDFQSYLPGFPPLVVRVVPDAYTAALKSAVDTFCDMYAEMLASVEARLDSHVLAEIDRRQNVTPTPLKSFIHGHEENAA